MRTNLVAASWWPFTANELQVGLGLFGFLATTLAFAGVSSHLLATASLLFAVVFYLAGLLVHGFWSTTLLEFVPQGGLAGAGYLELFRAARRSLLLMHIDDDPPCGELLALYRRLLDGGIQIRRTIFLRREAHPAAYTWLVGSGDHANLEQRVVFPSEASTVPFSFAIIDSSVVVLSVPGWEPVDCAPYEGALVLRHLLILREPTVVAAFIRMHSDTWRGAFPIGAVAELRDLLLTPRLLRRTSAIE
jgi:hypothetical protein